MKIITGRINEADEFIQFEVENVHYIAQRCGLAEYWNVFSFNIKTDTVLTLDSRINREEAEIIAKHYARKAERF